MCHPNLGLHGVKTVKVVKPVIKEDDRPNDAEYFFLQNEDVLH